MNRSRKIKLGALTAALALATGALALVNQQQGIQSLPPPGDAGLRPLSLLDFGPTATPTVTSTPTRTSTPDATGHLPNPAGVTIATRTFPGDHYPTTVAFLQSAIGNGTPNAIGTAVPLQAGMFSPRRGPGYGVALSPTQVADIVSKLGASPQATPRVQGYFLGYWGTAVADVISGKIAIVTTFWNNSTPVAFPTKERWFDPTAQAQTLKPAGSSINPVPLIFVFEATTAGSYHLSEILDGTGDYDTTVKTLQQQGWGPYFTFRP